jgi:hypothetical protein
MRSFSSAVALRRLGGGLMFLVVGYALRAWLSPGEARIYNQVKEPVVVPVSSSTDSASKNDADSAELLTGGDLAAEATSPSVAMSPQTEFELLESQLLSAPAKGIEVSKAPLADLLRHLASEAGIAAEFSDDLPQVLADVSATGAPYQLLKQVANANGVALVYSDGTWTVRPFDDSRIIARAYPAPPSADVPQIQQVIESIGNQTGGVDASVAWDSSTNAFHVIGPRISHQWVEEYLISLQPGADAHPGQPVAK